MAEPLCFETAADFRAWLARHADKADELIVGFHEASGAGRRVRP